MSSLAHVLSTLQRIHLARNTEAPGGPSEKPPRSPDSSALSLADLALPADSELQLTLSLTNTVGELAEWLQFE
ncbi:hypothetical protein CRENBAI_011403 [Crenichthys baileyi]|uniref:Uncharacterized protein n=1 Tax=Crenichthys baileyi TaxID=28760 RepID=A0AAV9SKI0_9TELE